MKNRIQTPSQGTTWLSLWILLICCLIAFWPLTFHVFSLKNDALNYFLPVRYQISEAISKGYWPFWSPYLNLGYPLHGDMQSGVWNPFVQLFSLLGPYTLKTLQYETLLYVYLSGVGMFFLLRYFFKDWQVCLLGATAFMLCGFNSDSAQFLNWISSASFLPFVFLFYYRTLTEKNWKTAICTGIFLFLLFTTAYPADFILTIYLLFFLLVWYFSKKENRKNQLAWHQVRLHIWIGACFILLSLPAILSYAQFLLLTERGSGASYADAMSNPLHPSLIFSFLAPLPVWRASFAAVTDPLTRNCFFGFLSFALLLLSFFIQSDSSFIRFIKWAFILTLLFSFGEAGGLRVISYYTLPLMDTFRHPSNIRLFFQFFGCMLAAFAFTEALAGKVPFNVRKKTWIFLLAACILLTGWALAGHVTVFTFSVENVKSLLDRMGFSDLLLINMLLQFPFLLILYFAFVKKIKPRVLLLASIFNCVVHTVLFQPFTVVKNDRVAYIQNILKGVQQPGYPFPDLKASLYDNSKNGEEIFKEIGSSLLYNKKIGRIDYRVTPCNLLHQNEFWGNQKFRSLLWQYPFFYRVDSAITEIAGAGPSGSKRLALVSDPQIQAVINKWPSADFTARIKKFGPNGWELEVEEGQPGYFTVFQNYYPRWRLLVDGKSQPLHLSNLSFMGFQVPAGRHTVTFYYKANDLKIAFFISLATLLLLLFFLFWEQPKRSSLS